METTLTHAIDGFEEFFPVGQRLAGGPSQNLPVIGQCLECGICQLDHLVGAAQHADCGRRLHEQEIEIGPGNQSEVRKTSIIGV